MWIEVSLFLILLILTLIINHSLIGYSSSESDDVAINRFYNHKKRKVSSSESSYDSQDESSHVESEESSSESDTNYIRKNNKNLNQRI